MLTSSVVIPSARIPRRPQLPRLARAPLLLLPWLAVTPLACGGSTSSVAGGDGGGAEVSANQASADAAKAYCQRVDACAAVFVTDAFGDEATCESLFEAQLLTDLSAPGTSATPAMYETCAAALPQVSCGDLLGNATIPACKTMPGTLAQGAACGTDAQCATTHCTVPAAALCGTCAEPSAAGGHCGVDSDCQPGMKCVTGSGTTGTCALYGLQGAACSDTQPCRPDFGCVNGTCGTPSPAGTACKSSAECDQLAGAFCNPESLTCQTITFAAPGGACGLVSGALVLCAGPGSECRGSSAPPYQGTCVAYAMDGASCELDGGPLCDYGAVCVAGTCQVSDPSSCK